VSTSWHADAFLGALKQLGDGPPKNLVSRARPDAEDRGEAIGAADLTTVIESGAADDRFLNLLGLRVVKWDATADVDWTNGTEASTSARRDLVCQRLGLDEAGAKVLLARHPIFHNGTTVITAPWSKWYTAERADQHAFYWPRYRDYLLQVRGWAPENVGALDFAVTSVVERLADPSRSEPYQVKGLVVGYVQSGKTANFTGVAAKAFDAGYRLVIVMTGTIELLRAQTQRRMDMELVGRQNILGDLTPEEALAPDADVDYQDDVDWLEGRFLDLGGDPIMTEIVRLTRHKKDYQRQFKTLKIDRAHKGKPLYDPENLYSANGRLVVTKKNATVLRKLVTDLKANKTAFAEIPVLIIDDESDVASVNTVDPKKVQAAVEANEEIARRKAINACIAEMLHLMPRAQYVGYTATPFANVFVDPDDAADIFPKDFVISLSRPPGYMGVDDFHDFTDPDGETTVENSKRAAFVRELKAPESDTKRRLAELATAIDMFVLTGACKLYRAAQPGGRSFRHHTMLVHEAVRKSDHRDVADDIRGLWKAAQFTQASGIKRLRKLYESDVAPVSAARREDSAAPLPPFDDLTGYLSQAITKIEEYDRNPVLVVNSDTEVQRQQQQLDFDRHNTWRILVGGAKLSRGFTVEGLTVTYFRRATNLSDSLTQMGRWFGFREGYRDLVRLYIDTRARFGSRTVNLYEAFEAVAADEAAFRDQLAKYAEWDGDKPRVLPSEIPPLVTQHLPWLRPTTKSKMHHVITVESTEEFVPSGYPNHVDLLHLNLDLWRTLLAETGNQAKPFPASSQKGLTAFVAVVDASTVMTAISAMTWMEGYAESFIRPKVAYCRNLVEEDRLRDFLLVLPQPPDAEAHLALEKIGDRAVVSRQRRSRSTGVGKFGAISDPKHRAYSEELVQAVEPVHHSLREFWAPDRGVLLTYLAKEKRPTFDAEPPTKFNGEEAGLVLAFHLLLPMCAVNGDRFIRFSVLPAEPKETADLGHLGVGTPPVDDEVREAAEA
jgi:hypothetical protein